MVAIGAYLKTGAALAACAAAALALAGAAVAQSATPASGAYARSGAPASTAPYASAGAGDPTSNVEAMTAVGDEPSSLPGPAVDQPDASDGAGSAWSASPAGDDKPLAVVQAGAGLPAKSHDQSSNVSAHPGLNEGPSDAH